MSRWLVKWPYRLSARTPPSQGSKQGSTPCRVTTTCAEAQHLERPLIRAVFSFAEFHNWFGKDWFTPRGVELFGAID